MTIEESNKLIAEFMEFEPITEKYFEDNGFENEKQMIIDHVSCKYSTSWDWLMPVVRKIIDICIEDDDHFLSDEYTSLLETIPLANIEDSYKIVIEFIQYYNRQER